MSFSLRFTSPMQEEFDLTIKELLRTTTASLIFAAGLTMATQPFHIGFSRKVGLHI